MKHFPKGRQGYDDFYDILVGIGDIGVMSFAVRAIGLLEVYLREKHGDTCADWFRDYWTGKFNLITPAPQWGQIPLACTCKVCYANGLCQCTILLASLFNPEIRVPDHYVAATPSLRKLCRIKGTAGNKRRKLIEEAACNEKEITSKVGYMTGTKRGKEPAPAPRDYVLPEPADCPSSDDFEVPI